MRAEDVIHLLISQPHGQIARDATGSDIAEQARPVSNDSLVAARRREIQLNGVMYSFTPPKTGKFILFAKKSRNEGERGFLPRAFQTFQPPPGLAGATRRAAI
jgi:hypothetical protein